MSGAIGMRYDATPLSALPPPLPLPAIPALPPTSDWVNVHTLGVVGDGTTDDTAAIQNAIDTHRVLYFPERALRRQRHARLEARHSSDRPASHADPVRPRRFHAGFPGRGRAQAVISAPPTGGANIISGFGFIPAASIRAPSACSGSRAPARSSTMCAFSAATAAASIPTTITTPPIPILSKRWDGQYPSLWVTHGGGGTFADIWTPDTFAQAGFYVSDTTTPGHVYELSNEHHVRNEIIFDHVENWDINAPQTEEEAGESPESLSLEFDWSRNITVANYHGYRVTRSRAPFPAAVRLYHSGNIHFRNVHINAESGYPICDDNGCGTFLRASKFPYENAIQDVTHNLEVREREFAVLDIPKIRRPRACRCFCRAGAGRKVEKLKTASSPSPAPRSMLPASSISSITISSASMAGRLARGSPLSATIRSIRSISHSTRRATCSWSPPTGPEGTVYSFRPGSPEDQITVLAPQPASPHPGAAAILPVNYWNNGEFEISSTSTL
jgi:hypothetical protein